MSDPAVTSPVVEFYTDAKILITGVTGFLGKSLLEKLLRSCPNIDHIYVIIRGKKGKSPQSRLNETLNDPVFDIVKRTRPNFIKKITCIDGDIGSTNLGVDQEIYDLLTGEITHVFHSAATVRFTEKLNIAFKINVVGLREIINLCDNCKQLKVFAHTSTAFCYNRGDPLKEEFRETPLSEEGVMSLMNALTEEQLNAITPSLIHPWPNTYCFTKAIAESIIKNHVAEYPMCVLRPSIVMGSAYEPVPGWVDNINGPTGILAGAGAGVLRVIWVNDKAEANLVPVDMVINAIICSSWEVRRAFEKIRENYPVDGKTPPQHKKIFNFVARRDNAVTWRDFSTLNLKHGRRYPTDNFLWYYTMTLLKVRFFYQIASLLLHTIPGLLMDAIAVMLGKKPQLKVAYKKIHFFMETLGYFCSESWRFQDDNTRNLWNKLSETDKEIFRFNMSVFDWDRYFENVVKGIRLYLMKQDERNLEYSRKRLFVFWIMHRMVQFIFIAVLLCTVKFFYLFLTGSFFHKNLQESIVVTQKLMGNSS